jgi:hypothetical protein
MTAICWDGKELVADSRGTQFPLDENNMLQYTSVLARREDMKKIVEPKTFTLMGEPVLALGVAGDIRFAYAVLAMDELETIPSLKGKQVPIVRELHSDEFYPQWMDITSPVQFIAISKTKYMVGQFEVAQDRQIVHYSAQAYVRDEKPQWAMIGSGFQCLLQVFGQSIPLDKMQKSSARKNVQMAIISDALSGGPLCIWKDDVGIQTVEVDPTVQAIKELIDERFNPLTMKFEGLDADGTLTKRIQAIVDERIAKEHQRAA